MRGTYDVCVYVKIKRKTRENNDTERGIRLIQYARESLAPRRTLLALEPPAASYIHLCRSFSFSGYPLPAYRLRACVRTRQHGRHELRLSTVSTTTTTTTTHRMISGRSYLTSAGTVPVRIAGFPLQVGDTLDKKSPRMFFD